MKIGTAVVSGTTLIKLTWLPEAIVLVPQGAGTNSDPTGLKVNVLGDGVITDLDNKGLKALDSVGDIAKANAKSIKITLADGFIPAKNVEISVTNGSDTNEIFVYAIADNKGSGYVRSLRQTALAGSGIQFEDIGYLAIPDMAETDELNVTFVDGLVHKFSPAGLLARLQSEQNNVTVPAFSNLIGTMDLISFIPTAEQVVYVLKFAAKGNVS